MGSPTKICLVEEVRGEDFVLRPGMFGRVVFRLNRNLWFVEFKFPDVFIIHEFHYVYAEVSRDECVTLDEEMI